MHEVFTTTGLNEQVPNKAKNTLIEESMDSLDFFKVTNLGRINNDINKKPEPKRKKWG